MNELNVNYVFLMLVLVTGLMIGSFLNVVIYRLPKMLLAQFEGNEIPSFNLCWPSSHCPVCKKPILKRDNIPVFSWLVLKGKCRHCRAGIPVRYLISEAVVGLWFTLEAWGMLPHVTAGEFIFSTSFFCVLYALAMIDLKHMLLPDSLVYMLLWGGMLASVMDIITVTPLQSVLGITVSWCIMFSVMTLYKMIRGQDGLGNGDVKLYSAVSAWLGLDLLPQLILISSILGCVFYLVVRVYYAVKPGDTEKPFITEDKAVPFGPAIALTALILFHVNVMVF